jgi:predicted nucleotidyltransferase
MEHDSIRRVLLAGPPLQLAILFGSRARGAARPDSDLDLAILPVEPALPLHEENGLVAALERATGVHVDLVRIDQAAPALRWRIARDGIILLSDPANVGPRFLARAGIEHDELRALETEALRRYRARLAASRPEATR